VKNHLPASFAVSWPHGLFRLEAMNTAWLVGVTSRPMVSGPPRGELRLKLGPEDAPFACGHCGGNTRVARGGVRRGGRDRAVYLAAHTESHRPIALAISLGRFGDGTGPNDRVLFTLLARVEADSIELMAADPDYCPFDCAEVLGRQLGREKALAHPDIEEVYRIAEQVAKEDPRVAGWLALTVVH